MALPTHPLIVGRIGNYPAQVRPFVRPFWVVLSASVAPLRRAKARSQPAVHLVRTHERSLPVRIAASPSGPSPAPLGAKAHMRRGGRDKKLSPALLTRLRDLGFPCGIVWTRTTPPSAPARTVNLLLVRPDHERPPADGTRSRLGRITLWHVTLSTDRPAGRRRTP